MMVLIRRSKQGAPASSTEKRSSKRFVGESEEQQTKQKTEREKSSRYKKDSVMDEAAEMIWRAVVILSSEGYCVCMDTMNYKSNREAMAALYSLTLIAPN